MNNDKQSQEQVMNNDKEMKALELFFNTGIQQQGIQQQSNEDKEQQIKVKTATTENFKPGSNHQQKEPVMLFFNEQGQGQQQQYVKQQQQQEQGKQKLQEKLNEQKQQEQTNGDNKQVTVKGLKPIKEQNEDLIAKEKIRSLLYNNVK